MDEAGEGGGGGCEWELRGDEDTGPVGLDGEVGLWLILMRMG